MSISHYWGFTAPFHGQHVKGSKTLVKSPWEYFYQIFCHCEGNWLEKHLCYWYLNSYDSFLTSNLFVIFGICRNYIKCNYLKNQKNFVSFSLQFWYLHQTSTFWKKDDFHCLCIFDITDWKSRFDECLHSPVSEHPSTVNMSKRLKHL